MADYLGVSRQSVGNWMTGRIEPSLQTLRLWALRCGVSYEWLVGDRDFRRRGAPFRRARSLTSRIRAIHRTLAA
jgi:transcriptional regulator with XRE-family HTH domain